MHPEKLREYAEKLREYAEKLREKIARKGGEIAGIHTCNNVPTMQERSGDVSKIHQICGLHAPHVKKCFKVTE
jgi:hypothetical protein